MTAGEMLAARVQASEQIRDQALLDAEWAILDICHRDKIIPGLVPLQAALAAVYVHRMEASGEDSRKEGEVDVDYAYSKEIPADLQQRLLAYRKLKQAGVANAAKKSV